ncbi:hypothetical protein [Cytobacillus horneckiae]|uniref:hypothetical protein n=1 Tax=Cytobacillus horneckiae TaxID=549687 RepID=UPI00203A90CF|nr:hypothetical protein [Cytobacillus horneckiae]MCM3179769.1 hypothetical protein [Cytobacillus horneckiae]
MDSTKKVLNFYGIFVVISWGLMFIIHNEMYTTEKTIQGMTFIFIAAAIFFILVHLYHKSKTGQIIVLWSLGLLFILSCIGMYLVA